VSAIPGRQHRPCCDGARKSKNGMGWGDSFKLQVQGDEAGRWYSFDLTPWLKDGIVVGGSL